MVRGFLLVNERIYRFYNCVKFCFLLIDVVNYFYIWDRVSGSM